MTMPVLIAISIGVAVGLVLGWFANHMRGLQSAQGIRENQIRLETELAQERSSKQSLLDQLQTRSVKIDELQKELQNVSVHAAKLESSEANRLKDQKSLEQQFEVLAQKLLESKAKSFAEQGMQSIKAVMEPIDKRIKEFQDRVNEVYSMEAKERFALKSEVAKLVDANTRISTETTNLTKALKGDSKIQGDWGELVLEKVLEASGLRKDSEYSVQSEHKGDAGERLRPDVLIHLPDGKHLIVDSKVSLKAYESFVSAADENTKEASRSAHLKSIKDHILGLSEKHYSKIPGIRSPDFVFLFMPIEAAYVLAVQSDPELVSKAWARNVALVTATTLFTNLRTVASIWKIEAQNKNALEIATEAGRLYDKFVGFAEDLEGIGKTIERAEVQHRDAMSKLRNGPGNVFRKMERLKELGATPQKQIRRELIEST